MKKQRPYTVRRYVFRIFIPVAIVGLAGAILRWRATSEFREKNVALMEEKPAPQVEEKIEFSEENRAHVINGLEQALDTIERSGKESKQEKRDRLRVSIERLETVGEEEWSSAVDDVYERLAELKESDSSG